MENFLILQLKGVTQAWGGHTYEDLRHSEIIPTRSGLLGLLAACLGVDRSDAKSLSDLSASMIMAVRSDSNPVRITDFHTVMNARKVDGKPGQYPVVSRREYLCDAQFTIVLMNAPDAKTKLVDISKAVRTPVYTPFLGRRSCAITRPLYYGEVEAENFSDVFNAIEPSVGVVYSDIRLAENDTRMQLREKPIHGRARQFATRDIYIHQTSQGA